MLLTNIFKLVKAIYIPIEALSYIYLTITYKGKNAPDIFPQTEIDIQLTSRILDFNISCKLEYLSNK